MHTTQELWQAALRDPVLAPQMQGVFPSDKLPVIKTYPAGLISNTDPHDLPGTHWVAMYFPSPGISEFFDSYGFPPEVYGMEDYILRNVTMYNDLPLQGLTSDVCGDYCLFYLLHRARNKDLNTIASKFRIHDSQWNDAQVAQFVHKHTRTLRQVTHSTTIQSDVNQCCQTYESCRKKLIKYC